MKFLLLSILFYSVYAAAFAQIVAKEHREAIALEEAIERGLQYSSQLQIDSINLKISYARMMQGQQQKLPDITANLSYFRISDNIIPFKVSLPAGEVVLNPQVLNQSFNSIQAKQLIWSGGKLRAANEMLELEGKRLLYEISKSKTGLKAAITSIWYNLYALQHTQQILQSNIELLYRQRKDVEHNVKEGVALQNELLKIDLAIATLETNFAEILNNRRTLSFNLCLLTGYKTDDYLQVSDTLPFIEKTINSSDQAIALALGNRPEWKQTDVSFQQAKKTLSITRTNYLPTISAGGSYNYDLPNQRLFPNQAVFTGTWNAGIFLNWSISGMFTNKQKVLEATLSKEKVDFSKRMLYEKILMEVNSNFNDYLVALEKIKIAEKSLVLATEHLRIEQNKLNSFTISATDFLSANTLYIQARINLATTVATVDMAYQKLLLSIY